MKAYKLIEEILLKESIQPLPDGKKGVIVLDIDDTLLTAQNIFIHKLLPDGKVVKLTPEEYAKDPDAKKKNDPSSNIKYSYEEFRDPEKVKNSIITGIPIINNLRIMDSYIRAGYQIAVLTARGLEDIIYKSLNRFLMFRDADGELKTVKDILARNMVNAINDETKVYKGTTDFEKKANVIKELSEKYDYVKFLDDDEKNLIAVKGLKLNNVQAIRAWGKELKEEELKEELKISGANKVKSSQRKPNITGGTQPAKIWRDGTYFAPKNDKEKTNIDDILSMKEKHEKNILAFKKIKPFIKTNSYETVKRHIYDINKNKTKLENYFISLSDINKSYLNTSGLKEIEKTSGE